MSMRLGVVALSVILFFSACQREPADFANGNFISYRHDLDVGASARDLVNSSKYKSLTVEIQYLSDDFKPDDEVTTHFKAMLLEHLNKPNGITITTTQIKPSTESFGIDQVKSIEETSRTIFTKGDQLSVYILYLPGFYASDSLVLGAAYRNTSIVIFGKSIKAFAAGDPLKKQVFDATVLEHEFGHLLGLVDEGTPMLAPHKDDSNGHHCTNKKCLMFFAFMDGGYDFQFSGGLADVPKLDAACVADITAIGGK